MMGALFLAKIKIKKQEELKKITEDKVKSAKNKYN
jgi:hypothetical protein